MERVRRILIMVVLVLCVCSITSCLFRNHRVPVTLSPEPLKNATQEELVAKIDQIAASVQTMNATVDIDTTVGGAKTGKVTEFQEIRGYILAQKPKMLRMIGLLPVVRSRGFDMVSDGNQFELLIPPKSRLIKGSDQLTKISNNPLENLRPQVIYESLLIPAINPADEIAVLEQGKQQVVDEKTHRTVTQPNYHILVMKRGVRNNWYLHRKFYFSRANLQIYRQTIYDEKGAVVTDASYSDLRTYNGILFPSLIEIERPKEEYRIALKIIKLTLNEPLSPEQFQLEIPPGTIVTELK